MYATCLFCHAHLGGNDVIEPFPVGRRLAFDPEKGRLWVVCPRCGRWNLSPLEERWEAIEECERLFRGSVLRAFTGNVGLARLREGLELVRIGRALRPELAAWRYGSNFVRRYRRTLLKAGTLGSGLGVALGGALGGLFNPGTLLLYPLAIVPLWLALRRYARVTRVPGDGAALLGVSRRELNESVLVPTEGGSRWRLELPHDGAMIALEGGRANDALSMLLVPLNGFGASRDTVNDAVHALGDIRDADDFIALAARGVLPEDPVWTRWGTAEQASARERLTAAPESSVALAYMHAEQLLAMEMLLHEESERRAMDGELAALERAWRRAEEVAAIADSLLLPEGVEEMLARVRVVGLRTKGD